MILENSSIATELTAYSSSCPVRHKGHEVLGTRDLTTVLVLLELTVQWERCRFLLDHTLKPFAQRRRNSEMLRDILASWQKHNWTVFDLACLSHNQHGVTRKPIICISEPQQTEGVHLKGCRESCEREWNAGSSCVSLGQGRKVGHPTRDRKAWGDGSAAVATGREFPEERVPHSLRWERPFCNMFSLVVAAVQGVQKIEGGKWSSWWTQPWISLGEKARGGVLLLSATDSTRMYWDRSPFWELSRFWGYTGH